jgi:hypothetical protein
VVELLQASGFLDFIQPIGKMINRGEKVITVK